MTLEELAKQVLELDEKANTEDLAVKLAVYGQGIELYRTSAPLLAKGCLRMKISLEQISNWNLSAESRISAQAALADVDKIVAGEECPGCDKLKAKLDIAQKALEFYAQKTVPDIESQFAKSAMEWGENCVTWEPLTDLGDKARKALEEMK